MISRFRVHFHAGALPPPLPRGKRMVNVVMVLLSVLLPLLHLAFTKGPWTHRNVLRLLLVYAFVFDVGAVGFIFGFIPHVFFADEAAKLIGWPPGNPFQFEVGLHDGAWGILGFLCVFIGGGFWLATALGWSFFMLGAAYGHVHQLLVEGNFAPYNLMPAFTDALVLKSGRIVAQGPTREVITAGLVAEIYGVDEPRIEESGGRLWPIWG